MDIFSCLFPLWCKCVFYSIKLLYTTIFKQWKQNFLGIIFFFFFIKFLMPADKWTYSRTFNNFYLFFTIKFFWLQVKATEWENILNKLTIIVEPIVKKYREEWDKNLVDPAVSSVWIFPHSCGMHICIWI